MAEFCKRGHRLAETRRIKPSGKSCCVICVNEYDRRYRAANPEKSKDRTGRYRAANREKVNDRVRRYRVANSEKIKASNHRWLAANPEKSRAYSRRKHLQKSYGLTPTDYDSKLKSQNGVCAICHKANKSGRRLAVDHDHASGHVRELLCSHCNTIIGQCFDSPQRLQAILKYLKKHSQLVLPQSM